MKTEEEFQAFKLQMDKQQLKRSRSTAIILGSAAIIAILFMIYGFTQNIKATIQTDVAKIEIQRYQDQITVLKAQLAKCESEKNQNK